MKKFLLLSLVGVAAISEVHAQKIDFDNQARDTYTATGYSQWVVPKSKSETKLFEPCADDNWSPLTINLSVGDITDITLRANWDKGCVTSSSNLIGDCVAVYGLESDGNTPQLTDRSVTMIFTISGLAAGPHSLLAYHNVTDGNIVNPAKISVKVNGETMLTGVEQSSRAQIPSSAGLSYVSFNAVEGESVVIEYSSEVSPGETYGTTGVFVNALVFDEPNPRYTALDPCPADEDIHVDGDAGSVCLSWVMPESSKSNHLYVGTSKDNMTLVSSGMATTYILNGVYSMNTYYWRVDEEDAQGNIYKGQTWTFRPRQLAFPGAEGYGRYATGGRRGAVYHVTSLEDYAEGESPIPGTLRYGIKEVAGPRTIVFDIAGIITLKSRLTCSDSFVTIAGQTAPGKGIMLRGAPLGVGSESITRFIRMRRGYAATEEDQNKGLDGLGMAGDNFSIMDHCSVSWTIDEAFSSRNCKNVTLQRTLLSEALNVADHPNYGTGTRHGYAATIGGDTGSYHHNLMAHNEGRNWSLSGGLDAGGSYAGHHDIFNNVCYNWGGRATDGGTHECNFVNNYYKMGPATTQRTLLKAELEGTGKGTQAYYVSGNIRENLNGSKTKDTLNDTYRYTTSNGQVVDWTVFVNKPFFESFAEIESAELAYKIVLSDVGANMPVIDNHDIRIINETLTGTTSTVGSKSGKPGLIDRESDAGGYEEFPEESRSADFDSDGDGMPDWWENAAGYNPYVADNNNDDDRDGYTALEEYLNWIAEPNISVSADEIFTLDLKTLFAGFQDKDVKYTVSAPAGLSATIEDDLLEVASTADANSLSSIQVTADNDDGIGSMTRTINLYVQGGKSSIFDISADIADDSLTVYSVYNLSGMFVGNSKDLEGLAPGIYIIKAINGLAVKVTKVIKK